MYTVDNIVDLHVTEQRLRDADGYEDAGLIFGETVHSDKKTQMLVDLLLEEAREIFFKDHQREILDIAANCAHIELEKCKCYLDEALYTPGEDE